MMNDCLLEEFWVNGYCVVEQLYDVPSHRVKCIKKGVATQFLDMDLHTYLTSINGKKADDQVPGAPAFYNDHECALIHHRLVPVLSNIVGRRLLPTYCYGRIYNQKSILEPHTDRPACQISVSMTVAKNTEFTWPFHLIDLHGKEKSISLKPGDGLIYMGKLIHWREPADSRVETLSQIFLHYVEDNWPVSQLLNDNHSVLECHCCMTVISGYPFRACLGCKTVQCSSCAEKGPGKCLGVTTLNNYPKSSGYKEVDPHECFSTHFKGKHRQQEVSRPGPWFTNEVLAEYHAEMLILQKQFTHHYGVICSNCGKVVVGVRIHCLDCSGFDSCEECHRVTAHDKSHEIYEFHHPWVKEVPDSVLLARNGQKN